MASAIASRTNANARSAALQALRRRHVIEHMVLVVAFRQAGHSIPRNGADRALAFSHPEEYAALYAAEKARA